MNIGDQFGMLTVVSPSEEYAGSHRLWNVRCVCGNETRKTAYRMKHGLTKSCGCLRRSARVTNGAQVGRERLPEYGIWSAMKDRCLNPKAENYEFYGGRGITVCDRWRDDFATFLADMRPRPSPCHSIDRLDNEDGYKPGNCRWATAKEQAKNRRSTIRITFRGETKCLSEWAAVIGVSRVTLKRRADRLGGDYAAALLKELAA